MGKAIANSTRNFPHFSDLIRDPAVLANFRQSSRTKPPFKIPLSVLIVADLLDSGDLIGRGEDGEYIMLVSFRQPTFLRLCLAGEESADLDPEVDRGEDEDLFGPTDHGAGDPDEAEEDDHPGGNIIDEPHDDDFDRELNGDEGDYTNAAEMVPPDPSEPLFLAACDALAPVGGRR